MHEVAASAQSPVCPPAGQKRHRGNSSQADIIGINQSKKGRSILERRDANTVQQTLDASVF